MAVTASAHTQQTFAIVTPRTQRGTCWSFAAFEIVLGIKDRKHITTVAKIVQGLDRLGLVATG